MIAAALKEFATANTIEAVEPLLWVKQGLKQNPSTYAANPHGIGTEAKFLRQPDSLAPAIAEELGDCTVRHLRPPGVQK